MTSQPEEGCGCVSQQRRLCASVDVRITWPVCYKNRLPPCPRQSDLGDAGICMLNRHHGWFWCKLFKCVSHIEELLWEDDMIHERWWRTRGENHHIKQTHTKLSVPGTEEGKAIRWKERAWPWSCHRGPDVADLYKQAWLLFLILCLWSWDLGGKKSTCNTGDPGSVPGLGRSPGEGNGNPLQYSCLENSRDRPWGCKESDTSDFHTHFHFWVPRLP